MSLVRWQGWKAGVLPAARALALNLQSHIEIHRFHPHHWRGERTRWYYCHFLVLAEKCCCAERNTQVCPLTLQPDDWVSSKFQVFVIEPSVKQLQIKYLAIHVAKRTIQVTSQATVFWVTWLLIPYDTKHWSIPHRTGGKNLDIAGY